MLSPRGWWLFGIVVGILLVAVTVGASTLVLIAGTLLIWFLGGWLRFVWQTRQFPYRLHVQRGIHTAGGSVQVLWARRPATIRAELHWTGSGTLPFVLAVDRVPVLAGHDDGEPWTGRTLNKNTPLVVEYRITPRAAGRLRFDGLKVTVTDLQGFFFRTAFVRDRISVRVLPPLVEGPHTLPRKKRHNLLPILGTHRLLRPGTGGELLDLRDYVPSDPPKLIAWKASARRDRLITKELESEVPIRSSLILDVSSSVRVGPVGGNALARLVEIAAALLNANHEGRDPTGLTLVDENGIGKVLRPARGRRAFYEILHTLADVADLPPTQEGHEIDRLLVGAMGLAQDLYPDLLAPEVNGTPWYSPRFWFHSNRRRKRVAAILANQYRLGPGGLTRLYYDDALCHRYLERWLNEHRVAVPTLLYDDEGRYRFRFPQKANLFAKALLGGVLRGKDNEMFVLLVDLFDLGGDLAPLTRAAKVALARHHQVQVVCPWPPGVPLPGEPEAPHRERPTVQQLLNRAWVERLQPAFAEVKRAFGAIGVSVLAAPHERTVASILERINRLRVGVRR
jgi:uncharacterized protein (DUF58 family)